MNAADTKHTKSSSSTITRRLRPPPIILPESSSLPDSAAAETAEAKSLLPLASMTKIMEDLYLGDIDAPQPDTLTHYRDEKNLGLVWSFHSSDESIEKLANVDYEHLHIHDDGKTLLSKYFPAVFASIDAARCEGKSVLLHCIAGRSRSAAFMVAYLMHSQKIKYKEAMIIVTEKRNIDIECGFQIQLINYEKTCVVSNETSPRVYASQGVRADSPVAAGGTDAPLSPTCRSEASIETPPVSPLPLC